MDGGGNRADGIRAGLCHQPQGFGFTLRAVDAGNFFALGSIDGGFCLTFGFLDFGFALARGQIDLLNLQAFGLGNARAFFTFGRNLRLHGTQNFLRRNKVFDFITQHLHAPRHRRFVQCRNHGAVDVVALFKSFVQLHAPDNGTQRGLRQLGDGNHIIA